MVVVDHLELNEIEVLEEVVEGEHVLGVLLNSILRKEAEEAPLNVPILDYYSQ